MSAKHELIAAAIRQYGTDPDGVERAMLAAGQSAITAAASKYTYADFLRKNGYDVDGPGGEDAPEWATALLTTVTASEIPEPETAPVPEVVEDAGEPVADVTLSDVVTDSARPVDVQPARRKSGRQKRGGR